MPNNTIGWGQAAANNSNGFGAAAQNNNINWGWIHSRSYGHDETNLVGPEPPEPSFFDQFGTPAAAYSLRDLSGTNPAVIEVRRSSDNAVQDFTASEITDGSLTTWVGAGNDGFVRTWYDQTGANDATQTTAAIQPLIVDAGALVTKNGKPAIDGNGTQYLNHSILELTTDFSILQVFSGVGFTAGASAGGNDYLRFNGTIRMDIDSNFYQSIVNRDNLQTLTIFNRNPSNSLDIRYNGITAPSSPFSVVSGGWSTISVFAYNGGLLRATGKMQEIIFYNIDQSSNYPLIEANINDHYSIY